ncbi:MAG TPA: GFA family protein [Allosphingosinicella sp.]|nr:GFA family protein [Allosphingosinicella sp.]
MTGILEGRCFCGAVAFEAAGAPLEMGYCHCADCRAWSGAPLVGFTLWPAEAVRVTRGGDRLGAYSRTGFSKRLFCLVCGGHVLVEHPTLELVDIPAGKLPDLAFVPSIHLNYGATCHRMKDGLPKPRDFPADVGGSGEMLPE